MAMSHSNSPFAYCIMCLRPLYLSATTISEKTRTGPNEITRVKRHYRKKHPQVFDQRFRR